MIISIDFDGTIVTDKYPEIGELKPNVKKIMDLLYLDELHTIIINSCRTGIHQEEMTEFLINNDIPFEYINSNARSTINKYQCEGRKVFADIYIDDRQVGGIPDDWIDIYNMIRNDKHYDRL